MRSKSYLFLLLVLGLGILSGYLYSITKYNFGLDVRGGIRFTYKMDVTKLSPEQQRNLGTVRQRLLTILAGRAQGPLGVTEPTVVAKGTDQFVIELPGLTDVEKAREVMGSSARIEFYHAKNVVGPKADWRTYVATSNEKGKNPEVDFYRRTSPDKVIKFGDPEYARVVRGWTKILEGEDLADAQPQASGQGYQPLMMFSSEGARKLERWSRQYAGKQEPIAAVLDGKVLSIAPVEENAILSDNAVINGTFPSDYVISLTNLLRAGALPVDLIPLSSETVDPTIGAHALDAMVVAGLGAFALICTFLLVYYSFPGFVAMIALCLYVLFTITVLKLINATFSLAGIAGFILSVGMAVDANILVFERFKEEMKRGLPLQKAIHLGFNRALPAIVDSNACTILTSLVLLQLGTGPVKGFATTLIIGVVISLFTAVFVTRSLLVFLVNTGVGADPKHYALGRNWFGEKFETTAEEKPLRIVETSKKWFLVSGISIVVLLPFVFIGGFKPNVEFRGGTEAVFSTEGQNVTGPQIIANLSKAGYEGANVKFGSLTPQRLAVEVPKSEKLDAAATPEAKAALVADALGLNVATVSDNKPSNDGGVSLVFSSAAGKTPDVVQRELAEAGFADTSATLQNAEKNEQAVYVTIPPTTRISDLPSDTAKVEAVATAAGLDASKNKGFTEIGPTIQGETLRNAVLGVLISSALIICYLALRFGIALGGFMSGLRFGFSAVGALIHDILFVLGVTAAVGYFLGWEISALFITSMLTVIGFSVHDTIVIFDRIRENLRHPKKGEDIGHLIDRSITQSFGRSINTSMTVIATLIILLAFGTTTPDLKLFCVTMLAGIASGTYSSIYNASPILYLWDRAVGRSKGEGSTLLGIARNEASRGSILAAPDMGTTTPAAGNTSASGRSYGQVRRRANQSQNKGTVELDD